VDWPTAVGGSGDDRFERALHAQARKIITSRRTKDISTRMCVVTVTGF